MALSRSRDPIILLLFSFIADSDVVSNIGPI